jgi:DEAD/DEAH box helicase domain-containing protein
MLNKIVIDFETQKSFDEVGGRDKHHLLKISVAGLYSYPLNKYFAFAEDQVSKLADMIAEADQVIGFNIKHFDFEVLKPYVSYDVHSIPYLDILEEVEKLIGHRVKLENLAQMNLGTGKSGDGLEALKLYKQGRIEDLKKYCLDDVRITKELYDYVQKYNKLLYKDYFETKEVKISFTEPESKKNTVKQGSLF